jgi:AbrB family looped-hinge helix DNA binding protein
MKSVVSEKGQVTIPKRLRDRLGIRAGQALEFSEEQGRLVATKITATDPVGAAYGRYKSKRTTDELLTELRGEVDAV